MSHSTRKTERWAATLAVLCVVMLVALPPAVGAQETPPPQSTHLVAAGENLYEIAARYGVAPSALLAANNLRSANQLRPGMRLAVPAPPGQTGQVHVVRRGETLSVIAERYGVTIAALILANDLKDVNRIFSGQRLLIPVVDESPLLPTPSPISPGGPSLVAPSPGASVTPTLVATPSPAAACLTECEAISILEPTHGLTITSPFTVTGFGAAFEQELAVRVLDSAGYEIGSGEVLVDGPSGEIGFYTGGISFTAPANPQPGRVQVYSLGPTDGAIEHLASVRVTLAGSGLDRTIEEVKAALEEQDYEALASSMTDPWSLTFYGSEGLALTVEQAVEQLEDTYLGPGDVSIDLSVDARKLLGDRVAYALTVTHIVYSTGWGPDQADDALLLFETDSTGQTRWGGLLYIFDALRDYPTPERP